VTFIKSEIKYNSILPYKIASEGEDSLLGHPKKRRHHHSNGMIELHNINM